MEAMNMNAIPFSHADYPACIFPFPLVLLTGGKNENRRRQVPTNNG
jgi:hypothetical protein